MIPDTPHRPMIQLHVAGGPPPAASPPRHETILPAEPADADGDLAAALATPETGRRAALLRVAADHPGDLDVWARLSELSLAGDDPVTAYAFARVSYHRGLDKLRKHGWGGSGIVRWSQPTNRGFLRGLRALLAAAAAVGEEDESARCREFLLTLDPDDALGVAGYPAVPGRDWVAPPLPETI